MVRSPHQDVSKYMFGQVHRLAVMSAIAEAPDGRVNPTDLGLQLGLAQSALQAPLRDLEALGLLKRVNDFGRRVTYERRESSAWALARELTELARTWEEGSNVRELRS